ncbi:MAG: response regulator [Ktedonobacteraceae bacterium]
MSLTEESQRPPAILVVEDDMGIASFLLEALSLVMPYEIVLEADSLRALQIAKEVNPILFLFNYNLPHMNGIELYDRLHAMPGLEYVPAIIISAHLPEQAVQQRNIIGLSKPFSLKQLLGTVEQLLAQSRTHRNLDS